MRKPVIQFREDCEFIRNHFTDLYMFSLEAIQALWEDFSIHVYSAGWLEVDETYLKEFEEYIKRDQS